MKFLWQFRALFDISDEKRLHFRVAFGIDSFLMGQYCVQLSNPFGVRGATDHISTQLRRSSACGC